ncbi:MAG: radical SAM protein [Candidatus Thorarchaeota archaeon]|nr:MAG: radical SAM protein [Candidatus Thorarchaeota archaeon]
MRVLLTVPNSKCDVRDSIGVHPPPLGLGYIASYISTFGDHEVMIHDALLARSTDAEFYSVLDSFSPDVVGISGTATPSIYDAYHAARLVKESDSKTLVVAGGAHVTFEDTNVLRECPEIDIIVRGEGETIMNALLKAIEARQGLTDIRGITYRKDSQLVRNPDMPHIQVLDNLPFPAYDLIGLRQYFAGNFPWATMITSRGCPYKCVFCSSSRIVGKRWRGRSPTNVVEEVEMLQQEYGVKEIEFLDDLFTFDKERVRELCRLLCHKGTSFGWTCSTRADVMARYPDMARWLRAAGCHTVYIGAESGNQRILNIMKKGILVDDVVKSVRILKREGLGVILSFVIGTPSETKQEMDETIDLACRLDPDLAQFTVCTPYPGTPLFDEAKRNGWLVSEEWSRYSVLDPVMQLPGIEKRDIKNCLHRAYLRFYTRVGFLWKHLKAGNVHIFRMMARSLTGYLKRFRRY